MCELTAIGMTLSIASQVSGFAAEGERAREENRTRYYNRASALADYNRQIEEEQRNFIAESRATQQKGFDEKIKARDARAKARAMAATQGAAGISVQAVLNELIGIGARNQSRIGDEQEVNVINYQNKVDTAQATFRTRINQNQPVSGPDPYTGSGGSRLSINVSS